MFPDDCYGDVLIRRNWKWNVYSQGILPSQHTVTILNLILIPLEMNKNEPDFILISKYKTYIYKLKLRTSPLYCDGVCCFYENMLYGA